MTSLPRPDAAPEAQAPPEAVAARASRGGFYAFAKRGYDFAFAALGLVLLSPMALVVALIIKLSDGGSVFYRQRRVGLHGKPFHILKFRTMVTNADRIGPSVTKGNDPRVTRIGRLLRKSKLDELPQLWNVLIGEMSFVGPRPEVPCYVDRYTPEQRQLLNFKPGVTDLATLMFRDEETLLRNAANVEEFYVQHCIPRKFKLNLWYARRANLIEDTLIILDTLCPYWLGVACGYILTLAFSLWLAYELRFDFQVPPEEQALLRKFWLVIIPLQMALLVGRHQLEGLLSYFDVAEMRKLVYGLGLAAGLQLLAWYVSDGDLMPPRSVILIDAVLALVLLAGLRTLLRNLRLARATQVKQAQDAPQTLRVGIVGAGELGAWLARNLNARGTKPRRVEAFFDDDADKWNMRLCDVPVVGMPECLLQAAWTGRLDEVILALPSASPERRQQILDILTKAGIRARTLPSLDELLT